MRRSICAAATHCCRLTMLNYDGRIKQQLEDLYCCTGHECKRRTRFTGVPAMGAIHARATSQPACRCSCNECTQTPAPSPWCCSCQPAARRQKATGSRVAASHLLEIHVLHDALARRALALGARQRRVLARVLQDVKAPALPLVLVEAAAPNGRIARGDAFPAVADELQALVQMA